MNGCRGWPFQVRPRWENTSLAPLPKVTQTAAGTTRTGCSRRLTAPPATHPLVARGAHFSRLYVGQTTAPLAGATLRVFAQQQPSDGWGHNTD